MKGMKLAAAVVAVLMVSSPAAMAIDLKMPGTKAAPAASSDVDAVAMQEGIVQRYAEASGHIGMAQSELLQAFDLKDKAAVVAAEAASVQGGATLDKDAIKKNREISADASDAIGKKIEEGAELSADGRQHYINSLPPLVKGMSAIGKLPTEASAFSNAAQSQIKSASLTEKASVTSKLSAGMYLAKEVPGFSTKTLDTFKKIVTYAQNKGIPVPPDATAFLDM